MLSRSSHVLGLSDWQILRRQLLRSGQCIRCFHLTVQRRARGTDDGAPHNAPKRGPDRRQRAAMVSEEVKMLQRDHPSPSLVEADPNTLRPRGAGDTVDPEAVGVNVGASRMGENDTASQDGPYAQGVGRVRGTDDDVPDTTRMASGARPSHGTVEEPSRGGNAVLDSPAVREPTDTAVRHFEVEQADHETAERKTKSSDNPENFLTQDPMRTINHSTTQHVDSPRLSLRYRNFRPAVIAGNGAQDSINHRIKAITDAGLSSESRDPARLAKRLMANNLVRFESKEEKAEVEELAKRIAKSRQESPWRERQGKTKMPSYKVASVAQKVEGTLVDDLVAGKYDVRRWLQHENKFKAPALYEIAKSTLKNGTYLRNDRDRFLSKVKSLLPVAPTRSSASKRATSASAK